MCLLYDPNLQAKNRSIYFNAYCYFSYFIARAWCILIYLLEFKSSQLQSPEGGFTPEAGFSRLVNHAAVVQSGGSMRSTSSYFGGGRKDAEDARGAG